MSDHDDDTPPAPDLPALGWDARWDAVFAPHAAAGLQPARVVCELRRHYYAVLTPDGEKLGECTGKFHHQAKVSADYPAVGDWVAVRPQPGSGRMEVHALLPRRSKFARRAAGEEEAQHSDAATIQTVLPIPGPDPNYNPKRRTPFLAAARNGGPPAVI